MRPLLCLAAAVALCSTALSAAEVTLGPGATLAKSADGGFVVISSPRDHTEYLINTRRIVLVKAADPQDNNSFTEIVLGLGEDDRDSTTLRIQQRVIPYEKIKEALLK